METRVGFGYDVHRMVVNRKLILGGVEIPFIKGLLGHSDADVLCHSISDALLGAAALGDIGKHFPDTDPRYKNISSIVLLRHVGGLIRSNNYEIVNVDSTVLLQMPKIAPYVRRMRDNISHALGLHLDQVSVKATTTEELGFIGKGEGAAAHAVVSIHALALNISS
jgi:2-C-methyl-D-erythritol 2,4-cyclodiphosphate synthase